ncbi:hypothetical protein P5P86_17465 [Nocardioides sp. BP30]|uniref:hypothetical protein n=1 Tax=Nocardioides sp. BP30 TaxID=3036374 RepID=UPI00246833F2|nr:hypothetical protein [Nocardioides sp. BP30]WGL51734.1 hypothetical protein P5P86_17465 [Nocardioides sp. BP30]
MARVRPSAGSVARSVGRSVAGCLLAVALTACGTGAQPYPPSGVDELVIPTPSPRPADFVDRIDNVWLPLRPGRTWVYDVTRIGYPNAERTVSVLPAPVRVDGISATAVRTVLTRPGETASTRTDYYAQDTRGDVWWLGQQGWWQAGQEGARAGLILTATPRLGDGYRAGYLKGVVEDVITVVQAKPVVALERTSALSPGASVWDTYRKGVGLVDRLDNSTGEHDTLRR